MRQKRADMTEQVSSQGFERIDAIAGDLVQRCETLWQEKGDDGEDVRWPKAAVARLKARVSTRVRQE